MRDSSNAYPPPLRPSQIPVEPSHLSQSDVVEERPDRVFLPVRSFPVYQTLIEVFDEAQRLSPSHILQRHIQRPTSGS